MTAQCFATDINEFSFANTLEKYSHMKYGSEFSAEVFADTLANKFFDEYKELLISNQCVVIPSPYNYVQNAASVLTEYFIKFINAKLGLISDNVVETSIIHRKVNYTLDYGYMSKEEREKLIKGDEFFLNTSYLKDKTLIFIDDVYVTGAHERRMIQLLQENNITNNTIFAYYAKYTGKDESFEGFLNKFAIKNETEFFTNCALFNNRVIVRSIKYFLSMQDLEKLRELIKICYSTNSKFVMNLYYGAIGEKYHHIHAFQKQFNVLHEFITQPGVIKN